MKPFWSYIYGEGTEMHDTAAAAAGRVESYLRSLRRASRHYHWPEVEDLEDCGWGEVRGSIQRTSVQSHHRDCLNAAEDREPSCHPDCPIFDYPFDEKWDFHLVPKSSDGEIP